MKRPEVVLQAYQSSDSGQMVYKQMMLDFLRQHDNAFDRACTLGHFTASAMVLNTTKDKVLLMDHVKLQKWLQLGGHCDGDKDFLQVAVKEAKEESGLESIQILRQDVFDLDIHLIPKRVNELAHYHYDVRFLLQADEREKLQVNCESNGLQWVSLDAVNGVNSDESVLRMCDKVRKIFGSVEAYKGTN